MTAGLDWRPKNPHPVTLVGLILWDSLDRLFGERSTKIIMEGQWREIQAEWKGGMNFSAVNSRGDVVEMATRDEPSGVSPMELLLMGLAGCTGIDVIGILQKKREPIQDLRITVSGKRADTYPMVYTDIEVVYHLWGEGLSVKAVEQAIQLSEEKYCSATAMLRVVAKFQSTYHILAPGERIETAA
jgi:putative redox protein